jgi:hypothetical protein
MVIRNKRIKNVLLNYQQAMASIDKEGWKKATKVEHKKMEKYNVF